VEAPGEQGLVFSVLPVLGTVSPQTTSTELVHEVTPVFRVSFQASSTFSANLCSPSPASVTLMGTVLFSMYLLSASAVLISAILP
jgi:hypothetical protein